MDPLLTPKEVADRLRVARRTAYDMLAEGGALYHLRVELSRKVVRVRAQDLEKYIDEKAAANVHK